MSVARSRTELMVEVTADLLDAPLAVTVKTVAGRELARRRVRSLLDANGDYLHYFPRSLARRRGALRICANVPESPDTAARTVCRTVRR